MACKRSPVQLRYSPPNSRTLVFSGALELTVTIAGNTLWRLADGIKVEMSSENFFLPAFNIFISKDLTKEAFIHWTDHLGKRHRRKGGINRLKSYEGRMNAALALVAQLESEYVPPSRFSDKLYKWLEDNHGRWRRKTFQTHKSKIDRFEAWRSGRGVDADLVKGFFVWLANNRHGKTHNAYLRWFKQAFADIGELDLLKDVQSIQVTSTPAKYFQQHQISLLKEHLLKHDPTLWFACEFVYYCFVRPGELRFLRVGDIHFDEWKVCVRAEISKNKKQQYVAVPVAFRPALEGLKRRSTEEYIFYRNDSTKPMSANYITNRFREVLKKLGFGMEYKLYSWKHTGAVNAVMAGISLKQLQILLKHHSLDMVDKYLRQLGVSDLGDLRMKFHRV